MLGLGSALHKAVNAWDVVDRFDGDFGGGGGDNSSDFEEWSVDQGSLTFTTNSSIPGTSDGGWLKVQYGMSQTSTSGIKCDLTDWSSKRDDQIYFRYDIYLEGDWTVGNLGNVYVTHWVDGFSYQPVGLGYSNNVPQDQVVSIFGGTHNYQTPNNNSFNLIFSSSASYPEANATFYIRKLVIKHLRNIHEFTDADIATTYAAIDE